MIERLRRLGPLLAVIVAAVLLAWLGVRDGPPLPAGSSRSVAPNGGRALFLWLDTIGRHAERLNSLGGLARQPPAAVFLLAPVVPIDAADRQALDAVTAAGGTLILAGDPAAYSGYLDALGITTTGGSLVREARTPDGALMVRVDSRQRLSGEGTTPLLLAPDGAAVAVAKPYSGGQVVVVTGVRPFTNDGLRDEPSARFVYRLIDRTIALGATAGFDETHYREVSPEGEPVQNLDALLRGTAPGRAVVYGGALTFVFLLLGSRRLGPPLPPAGSAGTGRTMFEQVQALAGLYRRARQLPALRQHFAGHYRRALAASRLAPAAQTAAAGTLKRIEEAPSEGALLIAVDHMEAALNRNEASPGVPSGTPNASPNGGSPGATIGREGREARA